MSSSLPQRPSLVLAFVLTMALSSPSFAQSSPLPAAVGEIKALLARADIDGAVERAEAWTKQAPKDAIAWLWLSRTYGQQALASSVFTKPKWAGRCHEALDQALALDAANLDVQFDLLQFYMIAPGIMGGGRDKAVAQAAAIAKVDASAGHVASGFLAQQDKDDAKAEAEFRAALEPGKATDYRRARLALGQHLIGRQRWADAREFWNGVLESEKDNPMAIYMLGRISAMSGEELDTGLAHLDRYIALPVKDPDISEAPAHWRRGLILEKLGRKDDAVAELKKAVALDAAQEGAKKDLKRLQS